ncbi:metallophosphoesterase [Bacillus haynesii]|nr:metallophosphoesterase [Bacillus haynesii]
MIYWLSLASAAFIGLAALVCKMSAIARENRLLKAEFSLRRLDRELNVFFISDIHRRTVSEDIIREVKERGVQLVIIGGDLAEDGVPYTRIEENIKRLSSLGKTYFVWGNNDYEVDQERLREIFKTHGVTALRNASVLHDHQGQAVNICGVDDIRLELDDYPAALGGVQPGFPTILVSHNPEIHHQIQEADGIDLILSGHTHGGQIRFGRFGLCEIGGTGTVYKAPYLISNGYGTSKLPLRLGARPETHLIKLVPGPHMEGN